MSLSKSLTDREKINLLMTHTMYELRIHLCDKIFIDVANIVEKLSLYYYKNSNKYNKYLLMFNILYEYFAEEFFYIMSYEKRDLKSQHLIDKYKYICNLASNLGLANFCQGDGLCKVMCMIRTKPSEIIVFQLRFVVEFIFGNISHTTSKEYFDEFFGRSIKISDLPTISHSEFYTICNIVFCRFDNKLIESVKNLSTNITFDFDHVVGYIYKYLFVNNEFYKKSEFDDIALYTELRNSREVQIQKDLFRLLTGSANNFV